MRKISRKEALEIADSVLEKAEEERRAKRPMHDESLVLTDVIEDLKGLVERLKREGIVVSQNNGWVIVNRVIPLIEKRIAMYEDEKDG